MRTCVSAMLAGVPSGEDGGSSTHPHIHTTTHTNHVIFSYNCFFMPLKKNKKKKKMGHSGCSGREVKDDRGMMERGRERKRERERKKEMRCDCFSCRRQSFPECRYCDCCRCHRQWCTVLPSETEIRINGRTWTSFSTAPTSLQGGGSCGRRVLRRGWGPAVRRRFSQRACGDSRRIPRRGTRGTPRG